MLRAPGQLSAQPQRTASGSSAGRQLVVPVRASSTASPSSPTSSSNKDKPFINLIPDNGQWPNGVPPVMGAHLMASGTVAPVSTSKGAGIDIVPHQFQYHNAETHTIVELHTTAEKASKGLAEAVADSYTAAVKAKGCFTLVLSGGSLLNTLAVLTSVKSINWERVHVFYVDERNVPHTSHDSTHKGAMESLLSKVPIPASNIHAILEGLPVEGAALNYEGRLYGLPVSTLPRNAVGFPVFDLILLGVGPDGHIASLFPNRPELAESKRWILPIANSPKPPPERITMTMPVINAAKDVIIYAPGEGKSEIVQRALEVQALPGALPVQGVRPSAGSLKWIVDVAAAQHLDIAKWNSSKTFPRSTFDKE